MRGGLFSGRLALPRAAAHAEALRPSRSACLLQAGLRPRAPLPPPSTPWGARERRSKGLPAPGRGTGRLPLPGAGHTQPPADSRGGRGGPHGRQHSSASPVWGRESPCLTPGGASTPLGGTVRPRRHTPPPGTGAEMVPPPSAAPGTARPFPHSSSLYSLFIPCVRSLVRIHPSALHPSVHRRGAPPCVAYAGSWQYGCFRLDLSELPDGWKAPPQSCQRRPGVGEPEVGEEAPR